MESVMSLEKKGDILWWGGQEGFPEIGSQVWKEDQRSVMQNEGNHSKQRKPNVQSLQFWRVWYVLDVAEVSGEARVQSERACM